MSMAFFGWLNYVSRLLKLANDSHTSCSQTKNYKPKPTYSVFHLFLRMLSIIPTEYNFLLVTVARDATSMVVFYLHTVIFFPLVSSILSIVPTENNFLLVTVFGFQTKIKFKC
jgi:archaellum biogenesis protein FlaJ (TadC family)